MLPHSNVMHPEHRQLGTLPTADRFFQSERERESHMTAPKHTASYFRTTSVILGAGAFLLKKKLFKLRAALNIFDLFALRNPQLLFVG